MWRKRADYKGFSSCCCIEGGFFEQWRRRAGFWDGAEAILSGGSSFCLHLGLKREEGPKVLMLHASLKRQYVSARKGSSAFICSFYFLFPILQAHVAHSGGYSLLLSENSLHFLLQTSVPVCIGVSPGEMIHSESQEWPVTMQVSKNGTAPLMSSYSQHSKHPVWKLMVAKCWQWVMDSLIGLYYFGGVRMQLMMRKVCGWHHQRCCRSVEGAASRRSLSCASDETEKSEGPGDKCMWSVDNKAGSKLVSCQGS